MVSEKWQRKNGKKSYFPKTKVAKNIKKEAEVDKKSGNWGLYSCRVLMKGSKKTVSSHPSVHIFHYYSFMTAKFDSYEEARDAEAVAQGHSTMSSFQRSYEKNQKSRKRPKVYKSGSKRECKDVENIALLAKIDGESKSTVDKEYTYVDGDRYAENDASNTLSDENDNDLMNGSCGNEGHNDSNNEDDINETDSESVENDGDESVDGSSDNDFVDGSCDNDGVDGSCEDFSEPEISENSPGDMLPINNFESTSELRNPPEEYDFSEDRALLRVEKLLLHVCREIETIKKEMKTLKTKSTDSEAVIEKLVAVCKDLSVEVFSCTEEFKKRNGMFTDLLVPDLKLPAKRRKHFRRNEMGLKKSKIFDNMVRYKYNFNNKVTRHTRNQ